jgi:prolyl oligopeptidase
VHPPTKRDPVVEWLHGVRIEDPYRWLEDAKSAETRAWTSAQAAHTRQALDGYGLKQQLYDRLAPLRNQPDLSLPVGQAGTLAYQRRDKGQNHSVLYVERDGIRSVVADPNQSAEPSHVDWVRVSGDGRYVFFGQSLHGDEWAVLHVYDTAASNLLDDRIPRTRMGSVAAVPGQDGFYYTRYPLPDSGLSENELFYHIAVYYHRWNTPIERDVLIFTPPGDRRAVPRLLLSPDASRLVIAVSYGWTRTVLYAADPRTPGEKPRLLLDPDDHYLEPFWDGGQLLATTNWEADTGRIIAVDYVSGHVSTVVMADSRPILDVVALDGKLVAHRLNDGASELAIFDAASGQETGSLTLPDFAGLHGLVDANGAVYYEFSGFGRPASIHRLTLAAKTWRDEVWAEAGPADPRVAVAREWAVSEDGTRVPVLVAHLAGSVKNGRDPTVLAGYGGFNVPYLPAYSPSVHDWISRGGAYALALLRGGREYGESWHRSGMRANKQAVFDDFYAASTALVEKGWTDREHLGVSGRSNGGLLTGAFLTQHPEGAAAVVIGVPLLDMLRFHRFLIADLWTTEYGSPDNPEEFTWLWSYSPYHHVRENTPYPAVLLFTSAEDSRVDPMHARKMTARLQAATSSDQPILFRVTDQAGHGVGKSNAQWLDEESDIWAFLSHHLGLDV